jgi:hypothetical protein
VRQHRRSEPPAPSDGSNAVMANTRRALARLFVRVLRQPLRAQAATARSAGSRVHADARLARAAAMLCTVSLFVSEEPGAAMCGGGRG